MLDAVKNMMRTDSTLLNAVPAATTASESGSFDMNKYADKDNDPVRQVDTRRDDSGSDDYGQGWQTAGDDDMDVSAEDYDQAELASAAGTDPNAQNQTETSDAPVGKNAQQTQGQNTDQAAATNTAGQTQGQDALLSELDGRAKWIQSNIQAAGQGQQAAEAQTAANTADTAIAQATDGEQTAAQQSQNSDQQGSLDITDSGEMSQAEAEELINASNVDSENESADQQASQDKSAAEILAETQAKKNQRNITPPAQKASSEQAVATAITAEGELASGGAAQAATVNLADTSTASQTQLIDFTPQTDRGIAASAVNTATAAAADAASTAEIAAEAQADTQLDVDRLSSRVVQWRNLGLLGNGGSARIRLTPPEMGSVEVALRTDGQTVQISMTVESESVRQVLQGNSQRLVESLQSNGLQPGRIEVTINTPQSGTEQNSSDQQGGNSGGNSGQNSDGGTGNSGGQNSSSGDQSGGGSGQQQGGSQSYYQQEPLDVAM